MNFIFDLYGTLVDIKTDENRAKLWRVVCRELGVYTFFWRSIKREYALLCKEKKHSAEHEIELIDVFGDMLQKRGKDRAQAHSLARLFRDSSTEKLKLFDGVIEILSSLRASGAGVYLLSNAQSCFTRHEIEILGLTDLFNGIILSSEVGVKKPYEQVFKLAFEKFGITPDESIYVGNDMRDDVLGASTAGMKTVYIHTEQSGRYDGILLPSPTYVAKNHRELADLLISLV